MPQLQEEGHKKGKKASVSSDEEDGGMDSPRRTSKGRRRQEAHDEEDEVLKKAGKKDRDPQNVPRRSTFFLHDERDKKGSRKKSQRKYDVDSKDFWRHDMFEKTQKASHQSRLSTQERQRARDPTAIKYTKSSLNPTAASFCPRASFSEEHKSQDQYDDAKKNALRRSHSLPLQPATFDPTCSDTLDKSNLI